MVSRSCSVSPAHERAQKKTLGSKRRPIGSEYPNHSTGALCVSHNPGTTKKARLPKNGEPRFCYPSGWGLDEVDDRTNVAQLRCRGVGFVLGHTLFDGLGS